MSPYSVIVDLSHREKIEEFPEFSMGDDEFEVEYIDKNEGPIDYDLLEDYDVLFMGNIQHTKDGKEDKFTKDELLAIKRYVGDGGGLFLTTGAGGDQDVPMKMGSLRAVSYTHLR